MAHPDDVSIEVFLADARAELERMEKVRGWIAVTGSGHCIPNAGSFQRTPEASAGS